MSGPARTMVAYPESDDAPVFWKTSAQYDTAGLIKTRVDGWVRVEHGFAAVAVSARTRTQYTRHPTATKWVVCGIFEATVPVVADYFGDHRLVIDSYFIPGQGFIYTGTAIGDGKMSAGRTVVRRLLNEGATQITFRLRGTAKLSDFQAPELEKSLKTRTPKPRCATIGHGEISSTHVISYGPEDDRVTEHVCRSCARSYSQRPALKNFTAQKIGA